MSFLMRKLNLCCLEPQRNVHKINKKMLKVSKVLAQLDTDVLIREIMGAIKGLVLEKKNNGINYKEPSCQIQWDKTLKGVGRDVFHLCFHVWLATSIISFDSNKAKYGSLNQNIYPQKSHVFKEKGGCQGNGWIHLTLELNILFSPTIKMWITSLAALWKDLCEVMYIQQGRQKVTQKPWRHVKASVWSTTFFSLLLYIHFAFSVVFISFTEC